MDEKNYTITLGNGSKIENLKLNGTNFISQTEITPDIFDGNLKDVVISDGEYEEIHNYMALVQITPVKNEWWFVLRDVSKREIEEAKLRADIDFIAMMSDIEL